MIQRLTLKEIGVKFLKGVGKERISADKSVVQRQIIVSVLVYIISYCDFHPHLYMQLSYDNLALLYGKKSVRADLCW